MLLFVLAALAGARVDPSLAPAGIEADFRAWANASGRTGSDAELVCRPFAERVSLCFMRAEGDARVYVTRVDGRTAEQLEADGRGAATDAVKALEPVKVDGFPQPYWVRAAGDGRDHTPFLHPDALRTKLGGEPVVAAPARGVLVAWVPGDLVFDKIVAVGVRRMYETLPDPVSPLIYRWDGEKWVTWGEARAVAGEVGPAPTPAPATPGGAAAPTQGR